MGLFDFFKRKHDSWRFVNARAFKDNTARQLTLTSQTLEKLREPGMTADNQLRFEYFYYTNTSAKAKQLTLALEKLNHSVRFSISTADKNIYIITGQTTHLEPSDEVVMHWTKNMCELGFDHDCDFDGWCTDFNH